MFTVSTTSSTEETIVIPVQDCTTVIAIVISIAVIIVLLLTAIFIVVLSCVVHHYHSRKTNYNKRMECLNPMNSLKLVRPLHPQYYKDGVSNPSDVNTDSMHNFMTMHPLQQTQPHPLYSEVEEPLYSEVGTLYSPSPRPHQQV